MLEHYKSLISDEEVIRELVKESKRREGKLNETSCRLKPNLNFFQRTVNSLISTNSRIDRNIDSFKADSSRNGKVKNPTTPSHKYSTVKKPLVDCFFDRQVVVGAKLNLSKHNRIRINKTIEGSKSKLHIKQSDLEKTRKHSVTDSRTREDSTNNNLSSGLDDSVEIISSFDERLHKRDKNTSYILNISEKRDDIIVLSSDDSLSEATQQATVKIRSKKKKRKRKKSVKTKTLSSDGKVRIKNKKSKHKNKE